MCSDRIANARAASLRGWRRARAREALGNVSPTRNSRRDEKKSYPPTRHALATLDRSLRPPSVSLIADTSPPAVVVVVRSHPGGVYFCRRSSSAPSRRESFEPRARPRGDSPRGATTPPRRRFRHRREFRRILRRAVVENVHLAHRARRHPTASADYTRRSRGVGTLRRRLRRSRPILLPVPLEHLLDVRRGIVEVEPVVRLRARRRGDVVRREPRAHERIAERRRGRRMRAGRGDVGAGRTKSARRERRGAGRTRRGAGRTRLGRTRAQSRLLELRATRRPPRGAASVRLRARRQRLIRAKFFQPRANLDEERVLAFGASPRLPGRSRRHRPLRQRASTERLRLLQPRRAHSRARRVDSGFRRRRPRAPRVDKTSRRASRRARVDRRAGSFANDTPSAPRRRDPRASIERARRRRLSPRRKDASRDDVFVPRGDSRGGVRGGGRDASRARRPRFERDARGGDDASRVRLGARAGEKRDETPPGFEPAAF